MSALHSVVLYYHRAASPACDPFQLAVSPDRFADQLDVIQDLSEVVSVADLIGRRRERPSRPRVAITFDDGYADNAVNAVPRLVARSMPATVYVTTAVLAAAGEFWWDRLSHLVLDEVARPRHIRVTIAGTDLTMDLGSQRARDRAAATLRARLYPLPAAQIHDTIAAIADSYGIDLPVCCDDHALLGEAQLRSLAAAPGIEIGCHTATHSRLAGLDRASLLTEIQGSRDVLGDIAGGRIESFAFPFGDRASYDRTAVRALDEAGYASALTTDHGPVGWWTAKTRVPRYRVENWSGPEFRLALSGWLGLR